MNYVERLRAVPKWVWISAITLVGLYLAYRTWMWLDASCDVPGRRIVMKAIGGQGGGGGVGCFEFWLYRYQGVVAAIIAFGAALIAVRPVWVQLAEMRKQSAEMARQSAQQAFQSLRELEVQLNDEADLLYDLILEARQSEIFENGLRDHMESPQYALLHIKPFEERLSRLNELRERLRKNGARRLGRTEAVQARGAIMTGIVELRRALTKAKHLVETHTLPFKHGDGASNWSAIAPELLSISVKAQVEMLTSSCEVLLAENSNERVRIGRALQDAARVGFSL